LLQARQGASEEQNNQMQEWQGDLQEQSQLSQWEGALQIITVLVGNLQANLKSVKDTAEKASNQIHGWTSSGKGPVASSKATKTYVETVTRATVIIENAETDLKGWCGTQRTTLNAVFKLLEKKVGTGENGMKIKTEDMLLKRIMLKGVEGIEDVKQKFESIQPDLNEMPTVSEQMGVDTCETGSLKDWEKGFTEQVATAQDLKGRGSLLVARVSQDLTQMRNVKDHLHVGNAIKHVTLFRSQVLPQLIQLLNLLDKCRRV
jgi:hypothetical protein